MRKFLILVVSVVACRSAPVVTEPFSLVPPASLAKAGEVSLGSLGTIGIGVKPPAPPDYVTNEGFCLSHSPSPCKPDVVWHYHDDGIRRQARPQIRVLIADDSTIRTITTQFDGFVTFDSVVGEYSRVLGPPDTVVVQADTRSAFWSQEHWFLRVWKDWRHAAVTTWLGRVAPAQPFRHRYERSLRSDLEWFWSTCMESTPEHCAF
jgi:hypothetical protein